MATKKSAENKEAEAPIEEVIVEDPNPMVTIRIPRDRADAEDKVVWVNEVRYLIQKGVPVQVPLAVAKILEQEEEMLNYIYEYESRVQR